MTFRIEDIDTLLRSGAQNVYDELLDCLSFFPWNPEPEAWFQYGLMRILSRAGFYCWPEYSLRHLPVQNGQGKADIAIFDRGHWENQLPSALIEVKANGSADAGFRSDLSRLSRIRKNGIPGIFIYFTGAINDDEREKMLDKFKSWCEQGGGPVLVQHGWHKYSDPQVKAWPRDKLSERRWGCLSATFA